MRDEGVKKCTQCQKTDQPRLGPVKGKVPRGLVVTRTSLLMKSRMESSMSSWPNGKNNSAAGGKMEEDEAREVCEGKGEVKLLGSYT